MAARVRPWPVQIWAQTQGGSVVIGTMEKTKRRRWKEEEKEENGKHGQIRLIKV